MSVSRAVSLVYWHHRSASHRRLAPALLHRASAIIHNINLVVAVHRDAGTGHQPSCSSSSWSAWACCCAAIRLNASDRCDLQTIAFVYLIPSDVLRHRPRAGVVAYLRVRPPPLVRLEFDPSGAPELTEAADARGDELAEAHQGPCRSPPDYGGINQSIMLNLSMVDRQRSCPVWNRGIARHPA